MKLIALLALTVLMTSCLHRHRQPPPHPHPAKKKVVVVHKPGHVVKVLPPKCKRHVIRGKVYHHDGRHWYTKRNNSFVVVIKPR